uniref:Uncharacterized protein n=1 Tax=Sphaerodactylus townsendi TaxID=933632 RepID=A0ACB8FEL1_9SAUR
MSGKVKKSNGFPGGSWGKAGAAKRRELLPTAALTVFTLRQQQSEWSSSLQAPRRRCGQAEEGKARWLQGGEGPRGVVACRSAGSLCPRPATVRVVELPGDAKAALRPDRGGQGEATARSTH